MSSIYHFLSLILVINYIESTPETEVIGYYPEYTQSSGVNLPDCGLRYTATIRNYSYDDNCYKNKYPPKTLYDLDGNNLMYELEPIKSRVYKGLKVAYGESPYTVLISDMYYTTWSWSFQWALAMDWNVGKLVDTQTSCTGSLITFEWVITAAHCRFKNLYVVWAGSNKRQGTEKRFKSKRFEHPGYDDTSKRKFQIFNDQEWMTDPWDIALIKLDRPFEQKRDGRRYLINTVCLPTRNHSYYENRSATFYGHGIIEGSTKYWLKDSEYLLKGDVKLFNCYPTYCVDYDDSDSPRICVGDSGGPLVTYVDKTWGRAVLLGVTSSFSPGYYDREYYRCAAYQNTRSIWASVPLHIDWILQTIENN